jgi:Arsenical resistance operon trans-acting repressor ArsD.
MCCSTGICGPSVDPQLAHFAADLDWLSTQGVMIRRYNLAQEPGAFAERPVVTAALQNHGDAALPLILMDGDAMSEGQFPSRARLAEWAAVEVPEDAADALPGTGPASSIATSLPVVQGGCEPSSGCC